MTLISSLVIKALIISSIIMPLTQSASVLPNCNVQLLYSFIKDEGLTDQDYGFFPISPDSFQDDTETLKEPLNSIQSHSKLNTSSTGYKGYFARPRHGYIPISNPISNNLEEDFHDIEANEYLEYQTSPIPATRSTAIYNMIRRYLCFFLPDPCFNCIYALFIINYCIIQSIILRFTSYNNNNNKVSTNKS